MGRAYDELFLFRSYSGRHSAFEARGLGFKPCVRETISPLWQTRRVAINSPDRDLDDSPAINTGDKTTSYRFADQMATGQCGLLDLQVQGSGSDSPTSAEVNWTGDS
ncbi:hypothetical protein ElyMa_005516900 [Elysia marginata]|uniref:Uncharacterized protein n=1 Tax=Elysia marginata TaxID=1093978 RepID=A0AAV4EUQ7_9GAST|nr:hypothetical protein ElyMa_005516900 [Elysia marginata]